MANYFIVFVVGLALGSFLNVVIYRFPEMKGILSGRSICPKCKRPIAFYDLVPILSYLLLFGHCRHCKKPISFQYPLVELSSGLLLVFSYWLVGFSWLFLVYIAISLFIVLIFTYDLKYLEIPEVFSWLFLFLAIIAGLWSPDLGISNFLLGGLIGGGVLGILVGISNERWMGSGDIKIGLGFGFLLGYPRALLFLFLSFIIGATVGVLLLLLKKGKLKSEVPFAPFLIAAAIISLIYGHKLIDLYLNFAII